MHNYFNLYTIDEVEKTAKYELETLFGAHKQPKGYWLSNEFKHFVLAHVDSEAGKKYNNLSIKQIRTMIEGAKADKSSDILSTIMTQIEILLSKVLVEEVPVKSDSEMKNTQQNIFQNVVSGIRALFSFGSEKSFRLMPQRRITVQLKVQE